MARHRRPNQPARTRGKDRADRPAGPVVGRHAVLALLRHQPKRIRRLWCWSRDRAFVVLVSQLAAEHDIPVAGQPPADANWSDNIAQGIAAETRSYEYADLDAHVPPEGAADGTLLLVLDSITDPRNLGAILRSAAFFGVNAVILPSDRAAGVGPLVERISRGATATLPIVRVVNLARTLRLLKDRGVTIAGTVVDPAAHDLWQLPRDQSLAIVLGAEDRGLRPLLQRHCDRLITLSGGASMDSLNVASFASVLLAALRRPAGVSAGAESGVAAGTSREPEKG